MSSIMIGLGLCERVYGLQRPSLLHEVVSTDLPITELDLRRHGWYKLQDIWTNGTEAMTVHTRPQPLPSVSAMRWVYDGTHLQCLDPEHSDEIRIDPDEMRYLRSLYVDEDRGWVYADPSWLASIVRLSEALPPSPDLDLDKVKKLYEKCRFGMNEPNEYVIRSSQHT